MGRDKALIEIDGVSMGRLALDALIGAGASMVATIGSRPEHRGLASEAVAVADLYPGEGPLGALITALSWAPVLPLVTLPCDLPAVTALDVVELVAGADPSFDATVAVLDRRMTPVVGVWHRSALEPLIAVRDRGERSVMAALTTLRVATLSVGEGLRDADTPGDLRHNLGPAGRYLVSMDSVPHIDIEHLAERHGAGAVILDVRQPTEYEEGHVPGAVLIPLGELGERLGELPTSEAILVICKSGVRSLKACELLASRGFDASNVSGGTMAWIDAGLEVATGTERG